MTQVVIVAAVAILAFAIGWVMQRRTPDPPSVVHHSVPDQIDRADFNRPEAPWLVAVFTSDTCATCAKVVQAAAPLESDEVAVQTVQVAVDADLHERYKITAVPSVVVADAAGVTRARFLGPPTAADLWATLADLRDSREFGSGG